MSIAAAIGRIGATLLAMVQTRLELASVELQQAGQRMLGLLAWTLLAVFFAAGAAVFVALFVIVLFWDSHRLLAVAGMAGLFALACALIVTKIRAGIAAAPGLLAGTVAELRKDVQLAKRDQSHDH